MKYFVLETATVNGQQASAVTMKENYEEALMLYHQIRASSLANKNVSYALAQLIDEHGAVYQVEYHYNPPEGSESN